MGALSIQHLLVVLVVVIVLFGAKSCLKLAAGLARP